MLVHCLDIVHFAFVSFVAANVHGKDVRAFSDTVDIRDEISRLCRDLIIVTTAKHHSAALALAEDESVGVALAEDCKTAEKMEVALQEETDRLLWIICRAGMLPSSQDNPPSPVGFSKEELEDTLGDLQPVEDAPSGDDALPEDATGTSAVGGAGSGAGSVAGSGAATTAEPINVFKLTEEAAEQLALEAAGWSDQTQELLDNRYQFVRNGNIPWLTMYTKKRNHAKFKLIFMDPW